MNDVPAPAPAITPGAGGPTIAILDDEQAIRESLATLLTVSGWRVQTFGEEAAFLAWRRHGAPAILILDLKLGAGADGIAVLERLRAGGDRIPTIVVSGQADMPAILRALRAGAVDVLEKPYAFQALLAALAQAQQSEANMDCARRIAAALTAREAAVLDRLAEGQGSAAIAKAIGIAPRQVEVDRAAILEKLGVGSVVQAVRFALAARACRTDTAACAARASGP